MKDIKKLESINILKCIAILMVLTVHQGQLFKNCGLYEISKLGQLGCQCFFVISGYTLCLSWDMRQTSLKSFYQRRFKAIAPGYYFDIFLFTLISLTIQYLSLPHYWIQPTPDIPGRGHLLNFLFVHGLSPDHINSIVPGGWYIGTTVLMYLSFPLIKRMFDAVRLRHVVISILFPVFFLILTVLFWYIVIRLDTNLEIGNNTFIYFNVLTQFPCFVIGGAIYTYTQRNGVLKKRGSTMLCLLLSLIFLGATLVMFYSGQDILFCLVPFFSAAFFGCVLVLLIKFIDIEENQIPAPILRICRKISGVSYEMYLLHTLFAYLAVWYVRKLLQSMGYGFLFNYSILFMVSILLLIAFSYYSGKALQITINKLIKKQTKVDEFEH